MKILNVTLATMALTLGLAQPTLAKGSAKSKQVENYMALNDAFSSIFSVYNPTAEQLKLGDIDQADIHLEASNTTLPDGRIQRVILARIESKRLPHSYVCTFKKEPSTDSTPDEPKSDLNLDCNFPQK